MTAIEDLHKDTYELLVDSNDDSYPVDYFMRDVYSGLKKYHSIIVNRDRSKSEYIDTSTIKIKPAHLLKEGMDGYKGEYVIPADLFILVRIEIATKGKCNFKKAKKRMIGTAKNSENYDECCNNNAECFNDCEPEYYIENGLIVLKWLPKKVGTIKIWYIRKPKKPTKKTDKVDFPEDYEELLANYCALRYAKRHEGQYSKYWFDGTLREIKEQEKRMKRHLARKYGDIKKTIKLTI